jgi:hypothetical protein
LVRFAFDKLRLTLILQLCSNWRHPEPIEGRRHALLPMPARAPALRIGGCGFGAKHPS